MWVLVITAIGMSNVPSTTSIEGMTEKSCGHYAHLYNSGTYNEGRIKYKAQCIKVNK